MADISQHNRTAHLPHHAGLICKDALHGHDIATGCKSKNVLLHIAAYVMLVEVVDDGSQMWVIWVVVTPKNDSI